MWIIQSWKFLAVGSPEMRTFGPYILGPVPAQNMGIPEKTVGMTIRILASQENCGHAHPNQWAYAHQTQWSWRHAPKIGGQIGTQPM